MVFGDKDRLMQLFQQPAENSLRATPTAVADCTSPADKENGRFALTFADSRSACRMRSWKNCLNVFIAPKAPQPCQRRLRAGTGDLR